MHKQKTQPLGKQIVVVDNGFIYVGDCHTSDGFLTITDAANIRKWGTTKGLSQLIDGPTDQTVHDPAGTVLVPFGRVVLFLHVNGGW